jgi:hypothetical protein
MDDEDDLPPQPYKDESSSFARSLGGTVGAFVWIALFFAIAGVVLYFAVRWFG